MVSKNIIILLIILPAVLSKCCFKKKVKFNLIEGSGKQCSDFEKAKPDPREPEEGKTLPANNHLRCRVSLCGNGKRPEHGSYCGVKKCNPLGCQCDGGCVEGKAVEEFTKVHGPLVDSIHQERVDKLMDSVMKGLHVTT
nr:venom peptide [Acharia stimulea]